MRRRSSLLCLFLALAGSSALATQPPQPRPDGAAISTMPDLSRFTYRRALQPLMESIRANQFRVATADAFGFNALLQDIPLGPTAVQGSRAIPVLLTRFSDTSERPWPAADLQRELFSQEWPGGCNATRTCTGTMTQYYQEISYGQFGLTGTVSDWVTLKKKSIHYQGATYKTPKGQIANCNGVCPTNHVGELISEAIAGNPNIHWEEYDNDGPDGTPNTADDDGFVDFLALVQPRLGGECNGSDAIWSHRWNLASLTGADIATNRTGPKGPIRIDDYVIMPAMACNGTTMIQIGVFAHEFGHAFGLPDLYDTSGASSGLGNWCLMAGGSWGGDGESPERPTHMSAWAKHFLGWISPQPILGDMPIKLDAVEAKPTALKIPISPTQYYLLSNIRRQGFDTRLPADGMAIWKINQKVVDAGLRNNTVNANPQNPGVALVQADGRDDLRSGANRGDAEDLFPGLNGAKQFDNNSSPGSIGRIALCEIGDPYDPLPATVVVSNGSCANISSPPLLLADPGATATVTLGSLLSQKDNRTRRVRLLGTITNLGSNLFQRGERKIAFTDAEGQAVEVTLPVPLETPPTPNGPQGAPGTAATILNKLVEVIGVLERTATGEAVLRIESSKVQAQ